MIVYVSCEKKFPVINPLCAAEASQRFFQLAAATAAATTTAFTLFTTAVVVDYIQFGHATHLLSYRRLSIDVGKKRGSYGLTTLITASVAFSSGANFNMICPQQTAIFSWLRV